MVRQRKHLRKRNGKVFLAGSLKIPGHAKLAAKKGLGLRKRLPASKKFGISPREAARLKIDSGVTRARRIIRNDEMPLWEQKKVARFYSRFKNCETPKCEGAHLIWGGRRFGRSVNEKVYGSVSWRDDVVEYERKNKLREINKKIYEREKFLEKQAAVRRHGQLPLFVSSVQTSLEDLKKEREALL